MDLRIDKELQALIPPLSQEEFKQLEDNILKEGCRDALVHWNGVILDGHNRFKICSEHGLGYKTKALEFEDRAEARIWMRNNQMGRRNLTVAWRIELQLGNKDDLSKIGSAKRSETLKQNQAGAPAVLSENDKSERPKHNTQVEIAKAANTSTGQVGMAEQVRKKSPELWEKAKQGEVSIAGAYKEIKTAEKKEERKKLIERQKADIESGSAALPEGVFEVVVIDPPWKYGREYDPNGSRVANPYPEMAQDELLKLHPPFADDCALFLWTTHAFIFDAKQLMDAWGFEYKATGVWDKGKIGMGHWLRMQCEFFLVGIKGKPTWSNTKWRDIIRENRREHSRKPEAFYEMVEDITVGRRLDYFSRQKRQGWEVVGNDTEKF